MALLPENNLCTTPITHRCLERERERATDCAVGKICGDQRKSAQNKIPGACVCVHVSSRSNHDPALTSTSCIKEDYGTANSLPRIRLKVRAEKENRKVGPKPTDLMTCVNKICIICQILPNGIRDCLQEKEEHLKHFCRDIKTGCKIVIIFIIKFIY